jgi:CBS domain-containing protein
MKVEDVCRHGMFTIAASESLAVCARGLEAAAISAFAVVDGTDIVGIITERDLVRALAHGDDARRKLVRDFTSQGLLTAEADEDSRSAAHRMLDAGIRHLPVVRRGSVIGMISMRDMLHVETGL